MIDVFSIFCEIFLQLMQRILTDNKSTMVQVKNMVPSVKTGVINGMVPSVNIG